MANLFTSRGKDLNLVFADGTEINKAEIQDTMPRTLYGTENADILSGQDSINDILNGYGGDDVISGNSGDDQLYGGEGNDVLNGGTGDDTLSGGTGNDTLSGGLGNDTYLFNQGDGSDIIVDNPEGQIDGGIDRLKFGSGITSTDMTFSISGTNLVMQLTDSSSDNVTVSDWTNSNNCIESIEFADGETLGVADVQARVEASTALTGEEMAAVVEQQASDTGSTEGTTSSSDIDVQSAITEGVAADCTVSDISGNDSLTTATSTVSQIDSTSDDNSASSQLSSCLGSDANQSSSSSQSETITPSDSTTTPTLGQAA